MNLFKLMRRNPDLEDEDSIEGERALTSVNKGILLQNRIVNWAVITGLCVLTGLLLYKYYAGMYRDYQSRKAPAKDVTRTVTTTNLPPLQMPVSESVPSTAATDLTNTLPPLQQLPANLRTGTTSSAASTPPKSLARLVSERRLKRDLRFKLEDGPSSHGGVDTAASTPSPAGQSTALRATEQLDPKSIGPSGFAAARAYMLPDPALIMTRGKVIPCTIMPAIDTTLTGIVTCITSEDATGADNKVSLMEHGTICVGQQGGGVTQGQRRVGIIWQRCETPKHVLVPLDSGATDALGRPGIAGEFDNHFWDRFGAAIALSLVSDIGPYLAASRQGSGNNNTTIAFPNILNGPQEVIGEILKKTMDIRPTISAPQGQYVLIYLAGDIDFRDVYQLERSK